MNDNWDSHVRGNVYSSKRLIRKLHLYDSVTRHVLTRSAQTGIVFPNTTFYVMFYYIDSRMYSASLLAMLNARDRLRNTEEQHYTLDMPARFTTGPRSGDEEGRKRTASAPPREIIVSIQCDTTVAFAKEDQRAKDVYNKTNSRYKKPKVPAAANLEDDTSSVPGVMFGQNAEP
ncbi:hypothetical protein C8Q80DRAFT_1124906 [Daedaleopsis nitida]|nr:hypothetical protein C8Q80DRAFT_1124906 [Daedaleopsis nitida]